MVSPSCTHAYLGGELLGVGAGCTNRVLAHSRSGSLRWMLVHPRRTDAALLGEDSNTYFWQADVLQFHRWLEAILHRKRTESRRHTGIHEGWSGGVQGEEGVNGGVIWSGQLGSRVSSTWPGCYPWRVGRQG